MRRSTTQRQRLDAVPFPSAEPVTQACAVPGCPHPGEFRAPKSPRQLREYQWLCLEHVREHNRSWNYFAGMNEADIEQQIRRDTCWDRPTWPANGWALAEARLRRQIFEEYRAGAARRQRQQRASSEGEGAEAERSLGEAAKALAVLGLHPPVSFAEIKTRYRALVKEHHPDRHGGDPAAEERLKQINSAFHTLKTVFAS